MAQRAIPTLTLHHQGVRLNLAPEAPEAPAEQITKPKPRRLIILFDNAVQSIVNLADIPENTESDTDLLSQVKGLNEDKDSKDGPDWMFDEGEILAKDPNYIFCPAAHRSRLLALFTTHFCQHPHLPERLEDGHWSVEKIHENAVRDMYLFCFTRGLREVWGYMWACWYSPSMWKIWARSTSPYISRLRTTMGVENFWRQLKHNYLHNAPRPRLDHLIWVLIYKVSPFYVVCNAALQGNFRPGRSKPLNTFQIYFKHNWLKQCEKKLESQSTYITNVANWTCTCGAQKFDCHHLCKHLIQAVPKPGLKFWGEIQRRCVTPLYQHPELKPINKSNELLSQYGGSVEPGSITDGDDYEVSEKTLGKRAHSTLISDDECPIPSTNPEKRTRQNEQIFGEHELQISNDIIDLSASSPCAPASNADSDVEMIS